MDRHAGRSAHRRRGRLVRLAHRGDAPDRGAASPSCGDRRSGSAYRAGAGWLRPADSRPRRATDAACRLRASALPQQPIRCPKAPSRPTSSARWRAGRHAGGGHHRYRATCSARWSSRRPAPGKGVQPIIGCRSRCLARDARPAAAARSAGAAGAGRGRATPICSACPRPASWTPSPGQKPQLSLDTLAAHAEGLLLLTGGTLRPARPAAGRGQRAEAERLLARLTEAFPGRVVDGTAPPWAGVERAIEPGLIALADDARRCRWSPPTTAISPTPAMHEAHDALLCIAEGRTLAEHDRRRVTPEHWFKPAADMRALFADLPEACDNTLAIARRCAFMAEPREPMLPLCPKVRPAAPRRRRCARMAREGLDAPHGRARRRCRDPRRLSPSGWTTSSASSPAMGFPGYFLIVSDFIQWAKAQGIPVGPGRGSGAGLAGRLGADHHRPRPAALRPAVRAVPQSRARVDARLRHRLLPGPARRGDRLRAAANTAPTAWRRSSPSASCRRAPRCATWAACCACRSGRSNRVAKLIPNNPAKPVTLAAGDRQRAAAAGSCATTTRACAACWKSRCSWRACIATPRTHAAGVVIGDRPLIELVPLYRDPKTDFLATQYSMKYVEQAGLVKFDFLGLKTLTILQRAADYLRGAGHGSIWTACRWTIRAPTRCWRAATPAGCSSSKVRGCATCCARCARTVSRI